MYVVRLLLRELQYRKLNFLLALVSVVIAVGLFVAVYTMSAASERETTRLMRDLGFNLVILPEGTDMVDFHSRGYATGEMKEEYVHRLAGWKENMTVRHLVARLQSQIEWRKQGVLLTGILPEVHIMHQAEKTPMGLKIDPGTAQVGFRLAQRLEIKPGDRIEIQGHDFKVTKVRGEAGTRDDIRVYLHLHEAQKVLGKAGLINEIEALSCRCEGERLPLIRKQIGGLLPGTEVIEYRSQAVARAETRRMVERYAAFVIPAVVVACAVWTGLLTLSNVRERRAEIGVLRAMGVGGGKVAALFLGKAALLGLIGAVAGFAAGTALGAAAGPRIFTLTAKAITPMYGLLGWSVLAAPLLCALASYLPAMVAVGQDPATVLREE